MEHCQCDWQGVQSDADNTEESITSSTTGRRIAKTCLYTNSNATLNTNTNAALNTNTNAALNTNTNPLSASKQDEEPSILQKLFCIQIQMQL